MIERNAVLVVDPQNDFFPGGSLAVPNGDRVVGPINKTLDKARANGWKIAVSQDFHPRQTTHFDTWPVHCVQGTPGAEFHPGLNLDGAVVFRKGLSTENDGYSPFEGVSEDGQTLEQFLGQLTNLYVVGLATDYCVKEGTFDALRLGHNVQLLIDAIAAVNVNEGDGEKAIAEMVRRGARTTTTTEILE